MGGSGLLAPWSFAGGSYPGTAGTCAATLAAAASCTIVVQFAPTALGVSNDTIDINYNNGVSAQTSSRDVTGTGISPALITISESDPYDFGLIANGGTTNYAFTLTNSGASNATTISEVGLALPFRFLGGSFPGTGGDCGATLAAAAACTIVVEFAPTSLGPLSDTIDISYNNGSSAQNATRDVQGTGGTPASLDIAGLDPYDFGTQAISSSTANLFTVTNSGAIQATSLADGAGLASPFVYTGGSYPGTGGSCGATLNAAASCTIEVAYEPSGAGLSSDTVILNYNDGASGQVLNHGVQGTGATPALITITDSDPYDYGNVTQGATANRVFTLSNTGGTVATSISEIGLAAPFAFRGGSFPGTSGTCTASLSAAGSCDIDVEFAPTGTGFSSDTINISYNDGAVVQNTLRAIQGTGIAPALLTISNGPGNYDYGTVPTGSTNQFTFTVNNGGGSTATGMAGSGLAAPFIFAGGSYPGTAGTCAATLAAAASCTIVVQYNPVIVSGGDNDTILLDYTDGVASQQATRGLDGIAVAPATLTISDSDPYNYGTLATGATATRVFTITNTGTFQASAMVESGIAAPYGYLGGSYPGVGGDCSGTLAGGGTTCTIVVEYAPGVVGTHNDTIDLAYNDGNGAQSVTRDVTGVAVTPASLSITDSDPYDYGTIAVGATGTRIFTISNGGGFQASAMSEVGLAAPFTFTGGSYPGTAGTCAATLAAAASCDIEVVFTPSATGLASDTIDVSYNNGASVVSVTRQVQGTGAAPANITITETDPYDFGNVTQNGSSTYTFTLNNAGAVTATAMGGSGLLAPWSFAGGSYPGTAGTCAATLAAAASCTIVVQFAPTALGVSNDTIDINYNNGVSAQTSSRDVTGTGISPALITISESDPYDFGLIANGGTTNYAFTLTNSGASNATTVSEVGLALPFRFLGGSFPGTGGDCGATLAAAAACTIVVEFAPTSLGPLSDTIDISYNDGATGQNATRDVQGTGGAPASLDIAGLDPYDFGTQAISSSTTNLFTVTNSGAIQATGMGDGAGLASPFVYTGGSYPGTGGSCGATLNAAASCTIELAYEPSGAGLSSDTLLVNYNDGASAQVLNHGVQGTGASAATITITESDPYDYGNVTQGNTANRVFTLNNTGGTVATSISEVGLAAPFAFRGGSFPGTSGTCTASLSAAGSCDIDVEFAPAGTGFASDTINISYNNGASVQNTLRAIQGTGIAPATLTISNGPGNYDYGTVPTGSTNQFTFTVSNGGGSTATGMSGSGLAAPFIFAGGSYPGTAGTCAATLAAAGSCTIVVQYNPVIVSGGDNDTILLDYTDGVAAQQATRGLDGIAVAPALLTITDADPYDYGSLSTGSTATRVFTITNTGSFQASAISETGLASPYDFSGAGFPGTAGTCTATLAAGANCDIEIEFGPSSTGTHNDTINISYNDGVSVQSSTRDVTGVGVNPANLTITDSDPYNYGSVATGASATRVFTITNAGGFQASAMSEVGLAAPYAFTGGSYPGTLGTCAATLAAAASCDIEVAFSPVGTGVAVDTIEIQYNNGTSVVSSTRDLTGTGVAPATITITETDPYDFGNVTQNASTTYTFTLNNTGAVSATAMGGSGLLAPWSFAGGSYPGTAGTCGVTLAAAGSCTIVVQFAPTALGVSNDTIDINYNDGASAQTSSRDVTGTGISPALLTISDSDPYDYSTVASGGGTAQRVFTITNSGASAATAMSEGGVGAPFNYLGGGYPGTGGDCGLTLGAGASCTIVVQFTPVALGAFADTIDFSYNDGAAVQSSTRDIQGTGAAPASLALSESDPYDYLDQAIGSSTPHLFTLSNAGGVTAVSIADTGALAAPFTFTGAGYPGTNGTCGATLAAAANCLVEVAYEPSGAGVSNDTINLSYNDGIVGQNVTRDVTGNGTAPANLTITEADPYDYGNVTVGNTANRVFTLNNTGGVAATAISEIGLSLPFRFRGGSFPGTSGTCTASLSASVSCDIDIEFAPSGTGFASDTISVSYFDGQATQNVDRDVQGTGLAPATLTISELDPYNYGTVPTGSTNQYTFTVNNTGGSTATGIAGSGLAAPYRYEGGSYPGTSGTCAATLVAAGSCTIVVEYVPVIVSGADNDTIVINYTDGASAQVSNRDVTGVAVAPASLTISESDPYDYGTITNGASTTHTFTITNAGGYQATSINETGISAPFIYVGGAYPGTGGDCGTTLAAAAACTIEVQYSPTTNALHTDTISFAYNDGVGAQTSDRDVQGTGVAPANLTITESDPYDFGSVAIGQTQSYIFTVTNAGSSIATAMTEVGLSAPYSFTGGSYPGTAGTCAATLNPALTCTIEVLFTPSTTGLASDTISMQYNNGATVVTSDRDIQGTGTTTANITITETNPYDYGNVTQNATANYIFTLTNTGGVSATGVGGSGLSAPFAYSGGSFPGTGGNCTATLAAAASCNVEVSFTPTATGLQSDAIQIDYNNGIALTSSTRNVQGTGITPALLTLSDSDPYNYGLVAIGGGTATRVFTVTNSGASNATAMTEVGLAAPYNFVGGSYPGTGGDCSGTLSGGGSTCTIAVEFAPTITGIQLDTVSLQYNDGAAVQNATRDLQGNGGTPATLTISDGPTYDYLTHATGSSTAYIFTITNSGALSATSMADGVGLAAPFAFTGAGYPGTNGTCSTTLAAAATCDIEVSFEPVGNGVFPDTIIVNYNNGATSTNTQRDITGTGASPALLTISDGPTYDYGTRPVGGVTDYILTVSNTGGVAATSISEVGLGAPFTFTGGSFPGTNGTCATSLSASSSCDIEIRYSPVATGLLTDTIDLQYNDGANSQNAQRDIQGTGAAPANLTISDGPGAYDYGTVTIGNSPTQTFTITNSGGVSATGMSGSGLSAPFIFLGGSGYPGTGGTCAATLAAAGSCTIVVEYTPSATGLLSDTIDIAYNDGVTGQNATRGVQGTGQNPATLTISNGPTYNYGTVIVGNAGEQTFTVQYSGDASATSVADGLGLAAPYDWKGGTYPGTGGTCGTTINADCTIVVTYTPAVASAGDNDTIVINYNNGANSVATSRAVTGVADDPALLTISEANPYDYGNVVQGATSNHIFVVSNTGDTQATAISEIGIGAPYTYNGGSYPGTGGSCGTTLNAGSTCNLDILFSPVATGLQTDTINISYNDGVTTQSSQRTIQGTGIAPASLSISDGSTYDYGTIAIGGFDNYIFTITNSGSATATSMAGTGLAAPYTFTGGGGYPGATGTCGATLAPAGTCTIDVRYAPTLVGVHGDTIQVTYNDGAAGQTAERAVTGTGANPATLTISESDPYNYGTQPTGSTSEYTFTVSNTGDVDATSVADGLGLAAPYDWKNGTYPGTGGTCGSTIITGANCTVVVTFEPTLAGTHNDTIVINYNNGVGSASANRQLEGVGADAANLTISDGATFDWQIVNLGFTETKTFTITNTGDVSATLVSGTGLAAPYDFFGGGGYPGGGTCTASIAPAASCTVIVEYAPAAAGTSNDTLQITYNDGVTSQISNRDMTAFGYEDNTTLALFNPLTSPGNDTTPTIRVNNVVAGVDVRLFSDAGCSSQVSLDTAAGATVDQTSSILADNTYEFHVRVEDDYGNLSACSTNSVTYVLDTVSPNPALWTWGMVSPADGTESSDNTPQVSATFVTGENGTTIQVYDEASCTNNVGSPVVVAASAANFTDISYLTNGADDGNKLYYAIATDTAGNASACTTTSLDYFFDSVNPNSPTTLTTATFWYTTDVSSTPNFTWATATDNAPSSGVNRVEVAISTSVSGGNEAAGWTTLAAGATNHTYASGLTLVECTNYYPTVRFYDDAENVSNTVTAPAFQVDVTNPTTPIVSRGTDQNTTRSPTFNIDTASTDNCSFDQYEFALSFDADDDGTLDVGEVGNVVAWKDIGNVASYQETGLTLTAGNHYFMSVRGKDASGRVGTQADSTRWGIPIEYLGAWQQGLTHTATAGTSRMLFVAMAMDIEGNDSDLTAMTYGGQAMFQVAQANATATNSWTTRTELWACNEACIAAAASTTIVPTFSNGATRHPLYSSAMFQYVDQATPVFDTAINQSTSTSNITTPSLNELETGLTVVAVGHGGTAVFLSVPVGFTESGGQVNAQAEHNSGHSVITTTGSNTYTFTSTGTQRMAAVSVHINPM